MQQFQIGHMFYSVAHAHSFKDSDRSCRSNHAFSFIHFHQNKWDTLIYRQRMANDLMTAGLNLLRGLSVKTKNKLLTPHLGVSQRSVWSPGKRESERQILRCKDLWQLFRLLNFSMNTLIEWISQITPDCYLTSILVHQWRVASRYYFTENYSYIPLAILILKDANELRQAIASNRPINNREDQTDGQTVLRFLFYHFINDCCTTVTYL